MPAAWFVAPYKRAGAPLVGDADPPTRYCAVDDFAAAIAADGGAWRELEVLGDVALVKVRAAAATLTAIAAAPGVQRMPVAQLSTPLANVPVAQRRAIRDRLVTMGYPLAQVRAALGDELAAVTLGDVLRFAARRRRRPRYDAAADAIVVDGDLVQLDAAELELVDERVPAAVPAELDAPAGGPPWGDPPVLDNFNRANGDAGANWGPVVISAGDLDIAANEAVGSSANLNFEVWNPTTFGPDSEVAVTLAAEGDVLRLGIRITTPGVGTADGYVYRLATTSSRIERYDNGVATILGANFGGVRAIGDRYRLAAVGSTITAYKKPAAGAWAALGSRTDATYGAAGYAALGLEKTTGLKADDFAAQTIAFVVVGRDLVAEYRLRELAGRDLLAEYRLRELAGAELEAAYRLFELAGRDLLAEYRLLGLAGAELEAAYRLFELVGADLVATYRLIAAAAGVVVTRRTAVDVDTGATSASTGTGRTMATVE